MPPIALPYFLSLPASGGPWPGIVVIHEGGGISPQLLRLCQRLASEGYATIAPDLFFRSGGTEASDYATLMGALQPEEVLGDIRARPTRCGASVPSGSGSPASAWAGVSRGPPPCTAEGFAAAVAFYGSGIADELGEPLCPTLLFFGGQDPYIRRPRSSASKPPTPTPSSTPRPDTASCATARTAMTRIGQRRLGADPRLLR
jgi:carboxymethylenebutenolidase